MQVIINRYLYFPQFLKFLKNLFMSDQSIFLISSNLVLLHMEYRFRANHSPSHASTDVLTLLYDNINDDNYTALLLLDLKKAFDTVNH